MNTRADSARRVWADARLTRRETLRRAAGTAFGLGLLPLTPMRGQAHEETDRTINNFANVSLPPDLGQAEMEVYVEATGHSLRGTFLDYWRANGAASVYGNPISEPFAAADGYYSQVFENAVFQYRPEFLYTADPVVRLMPIGQAALDDRIGTFRLNGRRGAGRGNRRDSPWLPLDPEDSKVGRVLNQGGVYVEATGHTISGDILAWYNFNEGPFYLGDPLSEPFTERGRTLQYFAGGLVTASTEGIAIAPLAVDLAPRLGIETKPVDRGERPLFDELLLWTADNPTPMGDPYAPGPKWIEVSISQQTLWAYQGNTLISTTLVSTGLDPNPTELGLFHIRLKYPLQDLGGFTDATGEVLGFGEAPPGTIPYEVKDVPNVMYFNMDGEALHGTYWHNNFGTPMSHGCVNLPLDVAEWMYGWAPLGTAVWVHE